MSKLQAPRIIYGTAWKKSRTADLVVEAVRKGFMAIDTACQPKHYQEDLVGVAISRLNDLGISRSSLFLQTKFTPIDGQDPHNIPYNRSSSLEDQVMQSFKMSQKNLGTNYIDSLLLHSPLPSFQDTVRVWRTFEKLHDDGLVGFIGLSNVYNPALLERIIASSRVCPAFLQNRFYPETSYDVDIRKICSNSNIQYQSFWTLTGNSHILSSIKLQDIAKKESLTVAQTFFRFVMQLGIIPLSGTTSTMHMEQDLAVVDKPPLSQHDFEQIAALLC